MLDLEQKAEHPRGLLRQGTKEYSLIKGVEEPVDHRVRQTLIGSRPINNTGMQNANAFTHLQQEHICT